MIVFRTVIDCLAWLAFVRQSEEIETPVVINICNIKHTLFPEAAWQQLELAVSIVQPNDAQLRNT